MLNSISVLIHSYNSARQIKNCIQSAQLLTKNIVVIDQESTDSTKEIAIKYGARVISHPYTRYVEPARGFGIAQVTTPWIFLLDADEQITPKLAQEIQLVIQSKDSKHSFFKIPRKEIVFNSTWLRHGGWWPNYQTRLIEKKAFVNWPKEIHSTPIIRGTSGQLTEPILHFSQNSLEEVVSKTIIFEDIESDLLFNAHKSVSHITFFRKFGGELFRRLFLWSGWKDGITGIITSIYQAYSKTITYLYLYEKTHRSI